MLWTVGCIYVKQHSDIITHADTICTHISFVSRFSSAFRANEDTRCAKFTHAAYGQRPFLITHIKKNANMINVTAVPRGGHDSSLATFCCYMFHVTSGAWSAFRHENGDVSFVLIIRIRCLNVCTQFIICEMRVWFKMCGRIRVEELGVWR